MPGGISSGFNVSSSIQYDRGVLLADDCEGAERWIKSGTGEDYAVTFTSQAAAFGLKGMLLQTKATTPADGDVITIYRTFPFPVSKLIVMRLRYCYQTIVHVKSFSVTLILKNEVREYHAGLKVSPQVPKMERLNSLGGWKLIGGYGQSRQSGDWDMMELQVDVGHLAYKTCLSMGIEKDLEAGSIYNAGESTDRSGRIQIEVESDGSGIAPMYFDSIYVGEFVHF